MSTRRNFLSSLCGLLAGVSVSALSTRSATARQSSTSVCGNPCFGVEAVAREIMTETGDWKEELTKHRSKNLPMVVTRYGCCGCEITLREGTHHPDWTYTTRLLTEHEQKTFREEYGNTAPLILALAPTDARFEYRGFILNGRREGWNFSVRQRNPQIINVKVESNDRHIIKVIDTRSL